MSHCPEPCGAMEITKTWPPRTSVQKNSFVLNLALMHVFLYGWDSFGLKARDQSLKKIRLHEPYLHITWADFINISATAQFCSVCYLFIIESTPSASTNHPDCRRFFGMISLESIHQPSGDAPHSPFFCLCMFVLGGMSKQCNAISAVRAREQSQLIYSSVRQTLVMKTPSAIPRPRALSPCECSILNDRI